MDNIISLCNGCHFSHHNGNPVIHANVVHKRGHIWYKDLLKNKEKIVKPSQTYYKQIIYNLEN